MYDVSADERDRPEPEEDDLSERAENTPRDPEDEEGDAKPEGEEKDHGSNCTVH